MSREFRLTLSGDYLGIRWSNVFHFTSPSNALGQAAALNTGFRTTYMVAIQNVVHLLCEFDTVYTIDTNTLTDYDTQNFSNFGARGSVGNALPPLLAWAFTCNTSGSIIRHGFKRFTGICETDIDDGVPIAAMVTLLNTLASTLDNSILSGGFTFTPIIPRYNDATPPVMTEFTNVVSATYKRISSQNSRKS